MPLKIYALGLFAVQRDDTLLTERDWVTHKTQQLFKILLTHRNHTVLKDQLIEWLWPELSPKNAANSLRVAVAHLRKALEPDLYDGTRSRYIISRPNGYLVHTQEIWLDVEAFLEKIREAHYWQENDRPDLALAAYRAAAELYRGDYSEEDRYEDWALSTREQLREAFYELRRGWADLLAKQKRYHEALAICQHLLIDYPLREEIWQRVMRFYADSGRRDQALRAYEQCRAILRRELEAEPLPETQEIYEAILHEGLPPPQANTGVRSDRGELKPIPQVQTLRDLLTDTGLRMAILTGPGRTEALEAFLSYARETGATVLRAQGSPLKKTLSFSILLEALQERTSEKANGLLPFTIPVRVDDACPAEYEYLRLLGGLCTDLTAAIGHAKAVLVLENLEHVDDATYYVLCHWALLTPQSDLLILGTQAKSFRNFWASELMELLQGRTIDVQGAASTNGHSDQNVPDFVTALAWAYYLFTTIQRWNIDPSDWLKLSDYLRAKLFCLNEQLAEVGVLWQTDGSWPEGSETWALNSYRCLLALQGFVERAQRCLGHTKETSASSQLLAPSISG